MGTLYVVGTPIGNLGDMSPRAVETLKQANFIAAEDTRVTRKLLTHFDIHTPMISYHQHNIQQITENIAGRISRGESCAMVSDAGMPCISDPGEELVALCYARGIPVVVVPGPSAVISALAISGLPTARFSFEGFLSITPAKRNEHLKSLMRDPRTLIFYEAPHKLVATLEDLYQHLGQRRVALCRELTKQFEEVLRMTLAEAIEYYQEENPRGEYVVIVEGASPEENEKDEISLEEAVEMVLQRTREGLSPSQAAREVASMTPYRRNKLYRLALEENET